MFHQPPVLHRFFFALRPPLLLARQIVNAALWFEEARGAVHADRLHITLVLLEDFSTVPNGIVPTLHAVGDRIAAAPFDVKLDTVAASDRSIALRPRLRNVALDGLRRKIAAELGDAGLGERADYRFSPHLTLGYRAGAAFSRPTTPVTWTADTLELIHSHVGRTRHEVLGRWTLRDPDDGQLTLF